MDLSIKRIGPDSVEAVHHILRECQQDMKSRLGLHHWDRSVPLEYLRYSTLEREVYLVCKNEESIATFTVGTPLPSHYRDAPVLYKMWGLSGLLALYVNRLAVLPTWQRQGVGSWCVLTIEELALKYGCDTVRLDAYSKHEGLLRFYQRLGYLRVGRFSLGLRSFGARDVVCFEKVREDFA